MCNASSALRPHRRELTVRQDTTMMKLPELADLPYAAALIQA